MLAPQPADHRRRSACLPSPMLLANGPRSQHPARRRLSTFRIWGPAIMLAVFTCQMRTVLLPPSAALVKRRTAVIFVPSSRLIVPPSWFGDVIPPARFECYLLEHRLKNLFRACFVPGGIATVAEKRTRFT